MGREGSWVVSTCPSCPVSSRSQGPEPRGLSLCQNQEAAAEPGARRSAAPAREAAARGWRRFEKSKPAQYWLEAGSVETMMLPAGSQGVRPNAVWGTKQEAKPRLVLP